MTSTRYSFFTALLLLLGLLLAGPAARAQAPAWQSLTAITYPMGTSTTIAATAAGSAGEVYVVGYFSGTATFGTIALTSVGDDDIFVARWHEATHTWTWAQRAGGLGMDRPTAVAVNGPNVYLTGAFANTATFGTTTLNATSYAGLFLAKVTSAPTAGTWTWALGTTSLFTRYGQALAVRGNSVYVGGKFDFDITFGTQNMLGRGGNDGFVAKATDAGPTATWTWAQSLGGTLGDDEVNGIAAGEVDVYVTGNMQSLTPFFGSTALAPTGTGRLYAARLVDAGPTASFVWAQLFGNLLPSTGFYPRVLLHSFVAQGNLLYLVGDYATADLQLGPFTLLNTGILDSFILRMTDTGPTGTFDWVQTIGGPNQEYASSVAANGPDLYVAGTFTSPTAAFGPVSVPRSGTGSLFVAKLVDTGVAGSWAWAQQAGGTGAAGASAVAVTSAGTVCVSGTVPVPTTFGSLTATGSAYWYTTCLATLSPATALATTPAAAPLAGLALYPNPAQRTTTVQLPAGLAAGPATLSLLDALGRTVRARTVALAAGTTTTTFDVAGLAPGVYALRVAVAGRVGTARLVVE